MARVNIDDKNNKKWDSRLVDAYMKNQSKQNNNRSTAQSRLPQKPDYSLASQGIKQSSATSRYESIPNYNIVERTFSPRKQYEYEVKQSRLPKYQQEKSNQIGSTLSRAGVTADDLKAFSAGTYGNSVFQGSDVLQALRTLNKKKQVAQKIKGTGLSASDVLDYAQRLNRANEQNQASEFADQHKILGTAVTFPLNAAGGISGAAANTADYLTGKTIDPNSYANSYSNMSNAMRGAVSNDFGKAGQLLYNVGTSIGDSATAMALAGGNAGAAGALQGLNSYNNSIIDTANRGLSPNQIMGTSAIAGLAEGAFEALPLQALKGIFTGNVSKEAGKGIIKSVLNQMVNEGASEMTTEGINQVADRIINGDLSNYAKSVDQYQKQGMSESEAEKQAVIDVFKQVGYSGLAGAVSGGIMGGGTALAGRVIGNRNSNIKQNIDVDSNIEFNDTAKDNINSVDTMYIKDSHPVEAAATNVATPQRPKRSTGKATDVNIPNSAENVNGTQYNSKKIEGFNDLDKALDRLVGMYKGNENTASMYADMKSAINEYLQTGNQSAIDKAVTLAAEIDDSMKGQSYTRKGSGKGTAKSQNNRVTTSFTEGEFVDTLMSYGKYLRDAAKKSTANVNQQSNTAPVQNVQQSVEQNNMQMQQNTDQTGNQRMRSYNDTLVNKTDAPQALKNEFVANPDMYTQLSNADTKAKADAILASGNIDSAIVQFRQMIDGTKKDPAAVPLGYNIAKELTNAGRVDEAVQIVRDMSKALTESGQFSQAAAITMLNNDPQAAMRYLVREIDSMNEAGKKKFKDKWQNFEMTDSEVKQFADIDPGDTDAIKAAYENVYDRLRKAYPVTMTEKLMELRRVSMLLNARTNVRNFVSNAFMMPIRWTADRVTALGEGAYKLIHPEYQSTQSANPVASKESRQLASEAFETVREELLGDNKYNDAQGAIRDKQIFKGSKFSEMFDNLTNGALTRANQAMGKDVSPSLMETARNFTYYLLEKGDDVFVKKNFESRMASYLEAQGITDLESIPADAYTLATQEAYKATFKDDTKLATILSDVRRTLGVPGDIVMPFTKTPANIAMRGIDYSPVGVANALVKLKNAKSNVEVSNALTLLGQGATGTAAIAVGYALAQSGIIQGALSDDKDEAQWEKSHGKLAYSVKVGDNYYTFDWAQPASIPIILGTTIYQCMQDSDNALDTIYQGAVAATNAWSDLSPLQTLTDIFGGNGTPAENIADTFLEAPLGWIPAQLGAAARIGNTTQRVTYDNNSKLNNIINQAKSKIPGMSQALPVAYDTWGNPIKRQDSTGEAALANLLNPGQIGNIRETTIDDEINDLYASTGDAAVFPKKAAWSYKINGETVKLNSEQYSEYQRIMGQNAYGMASALINSASYNNMSDDQKAGAIADLYNFADALAKTELLGYDIESSQTYKKMYEIYQDKGAVGVATFLGIKQSMDSNKAEDKVAAVADIPGSDEDKGYYLSLLIGSLSKEAQTAYDYNGYPGVYWYYAQKTGIGDYSGYKESNYKKIQSMLDGTYTDPVASSNEESQAKIQAMLDGTYDSVYGSGASNENQRKIAAMINGTYTGNQDSDYQARLQRIRDMLK